MLGNAQLTRGDLTPIGIGILQVVDQALGGNLARLRAGGSPARRQGCSRDESRRQPPGT